MSNFGQFNNFLLFLHKDDLEIFPPEFHLLIPTKSDSSDELSLEKYI